MCARLLMPLLLLAGCCDAVIVDRIAIVVGNAIVKDSDIERDIRVTDFLNGQPLSITLATRKSAAGRLVDQIFIRQEIRAGDYARATPEEADKQLEPLKHHRFRLDQSYGAELHRYGLTDQQVRQQLQWQLTVLSFIDLRFKPAAYVSDDELTHYYREHSSQLERQNPGKTTMEQLRPVITDILAEEKVNKLFFSWLDDQRKNAHVDYHEEGLR